MRVVHLMAPSPVGGAEQVVLDLTGVLADRGVDVHLIPILEPGDEAHPFLARTAEGVPTHPLFLPPRRYDLERRRVRALIRDLGPCIVHTHGYRAVVVDGRVARGLGLPTVATVHGFTGGGLRNRLYEWFQQRAFRRYDAVVAVSEPMVRELERRGIREERIHTIPNARVRPNHMWDASAARQELGVPPGAFHVGWIGRLSREKGPDVMISAFKRLVDGAQVPDPLLTFIGEGGQRTELEATAGELGLEGSVRWLGRVPDAASLLRGFDVVVLSSRTEGTPVVALEAMIAGVPLVATRVGGVPDLTGERAALLVGPEDPDALAEAIEGVFADPEDAAQRVQAAHVRVHEVASPEAWADRYLEVYHELSHGRTW